MTEKDDITVNVPIDKYKSLIETVKKQDKVIKAISKTDHVIVIDNREDNRLYGFNFHINVPKVTSDIDHAEKMFQKEVEALHEQVYNLTLEIKELNKPKLKPKEKKKWWGKKIINQLF